MVYSLRLTIACVAASALAGCATVDIDQAIADTDRVTQDFTRGHLALARTDPQRMARRQLANQLIAHPLGMDEAVQLGLANSPFIQSLLAEGWAAMAAAEQAGRIANPVFTFERVRLHDELELGRLLSIGLLDLLTWPQRHAVSQNRLAQAKLELGTSVVEQVGDIRHAWVRAVAARQLLQYAEQVNEGAQASAELARRMQQVGNFTRLQRARQHLFYADATAQLASARHAATASREALVRRLGLDDAQAARLQLPERLPDLPNQPRAAIDVGTAALQQRLDVRMARLQLDAAGKAQGLELLNTLVDTELGGRRDTAFDNATGERSHRKGYELAIRLPLFDWGGAQRAAMNAQSLAAANRHDGIVRAATSHLRESYSAYRTAYDVARHLRDEVVPLRKAISDENVLRYNGMLIGVFELLADSRDQIASVMAAIDAQQQYWLADAALSSSVVGKPLPAAATPVPASAPGAAQGQGH